MYEENKQLVKKRFKNILLCQKTVFTIFQNSYHLRIQCPSISVWYWHLDPMQIPVIFFRCLNSLYCKKLAIYIYYHIYSSVLLCLNNLQYLINYKCCINNSYAILFRECSQKSLYRCVLLSCMFSI